MFHGRGRADARKSQYMQGKEAEEANADRAKAQRKIREVYNSLDRGECLVPKGSRLPLVINTKES